MKDQIPLAHDALGPTVTIGEILVEIMSTSIGSPAFAVEKVDPTGAGKRFG